MPPEQIPFNLVKLGERIRSSYEGIDELAETLEHNGLIQPLVLVQLEDGTYEVNAGGRRYHALTRLLELELWDGILHHATTSAKNPLRPGYVLKGDDESSTLQKLLTEIAENLDRRDVDWRDEVRAYTKAWRLAKAQADANSQRLLMRDFGSTLGTGYSDLQAAVYVHDDLIAHPEDYKTVQYIRGAYQVLFKKNIAELAKLQATKSIVTLPLSTSSQPVLIPLEPKREGEPDPVYIPLTQAFIHTDSIKFMESLPPDQFDHIVTDPDYGVSVERLEASVGGAAGGVHQDTIEQSLLTLNDFLIQAFRMVRPQGFCVFFYDLDHHEKLQRYAIEAGWRVQRWPLIWVKNDYRSNAAPAHNFCKNVEYAMVCRKPNALLVQAQMTSVFNTPSGDTVKKFGHPFAKPLDLYKWIFNAIAIKGQSVYDPFLGSGTSACAAVDFGLRPVGSEIDIDHYTNAVLNIQDAYKKLIGEHVRFT